MTMKADELFQHILAAKDEDELMSSVNMIALEKNYSFYQYEVLFFTEIFRYPTFVITDLDYITSADLSFNRLKDTAVQDKLTTIHSTKKMSNDHYFNFIQENRKLNGEEYTITIPMSGHYGEEAYMCVGIKDKGILPSVELISDITHTTSIIMNSCSRIILKKKYKDCFKLLTNKEKTCIGLLGYGFSDKEIATHMRLSYAAVRYHINNISIKLHAKNRAHIVSKAFSLGIIKTDLLYYT